MRRFTTPLLLGLLALMVFAMPPSAGRVWCLKDPIVKLNGTHVQLWVGIEEQYVPYVNGPIDVMVQTPNKVHRDVVFLDDGFNGYGETVRFGDLRGVVAKDGTFTTQVRATVPLDRTALWKQTKLRDVPLQLTIIHEDGMTEVIEMTNDGGWITFDLKGKWGR